MKTMTAKSRQSLNRVCGLVAAVAMVVPFAGAQSAASRISSPIVNVEQAALNHSLHPLAQPRFDAGRMPPETPLTGIGMVFSRSAAQEADLKALIAAQQTPSSPLYHQWLTPEQFAARFGMSDADLGKVQNWLQEQGFSIDSVARGKNAIHFSGTARQVEQAFTTEMHFYKVNGTQHFAPSTDLSVPSALASTVLGIQNLDDFKPRAQVILRKNLRANPAYTAGGSTNAQNQLILFAPGDIKTAYDILPLYNSGITGTGQTITVVGQSAVQMSDLEAFQSAAGLAVKDPSIYLVPNSGTSTVYATGDEAESDLDLEWSNSIAPGATINFVYVGNGANYSTFDSIQYAIDQKIGNIVTSSYGTCETALNGTTMESSLEQGTAQGQTFLSASGDNGSTDCYGITGLSTAQQQALAVDYPASSVYVTGVGGTEIDSSNAAYSTVGQGYWEANSGTGDLVNSVLQYIPEMAWNDDTPNCGASNCLSSSGGGVSSLFTKPSWQTGVAGIPTDGKRDVPDMALYASPNYPGFLFCSSDTSAWNTTQQPIQTASCTSGFQDASTGNLTAAGGTSFDAPIFAGIVALINQKQGYTTGQGLVNSTLYKLAANSATYSSAFHDITSGNNNCTAGSPYCSGTPGFTAGVGYDQVTGLGSVDAAMLAGVWPASTAGTLTPTTTTISAANTAPSVGASDSFTITVAAGTGTPSGTIALSVDGGAAVTETLASNATYVYSTSFSIAGAHTVFASYAGDTTFGPSTASVTVNVAVVSTGKGTFAITATPGTLTVPQGTSGTETITVTPSSYTGTVNLTFSSTNSSGLQDLCPNFSGTNSANGSVAVSGASAAATTLVMDTNAADCAPVNNGGGYYGGGYYFKKAGGKSASNSLRPLNPAKSHGGSRVPASIAFAGLLLMGLLGRNSRKLRGLAGVLLLAAVGLAVTACNNYGNSYPDPSKGTYTITVTGQDSVTGTITGSSTFTFIIQ